MENFETAGHNPWELMPLGALPYAMHRKSPLQLHHYDLRHYEAGGV